MMTGVIEAIMMYRLCNAFFAKKSEYKNEIYIWFIVGLAIMINMSNILFGTDFWNVIGMIVAFFIMTCFYEGNTFLKIFLSVLNYLILVITELIVLFGITIVYNVSVSMVVEESLYRVLGAIVSKMLALFVASILCLRFRKKKIYLGMQYYYVLFLIMFITSTATMFLVFKLSYDRADTSMSELTVVCSIGLLLSTFFALFLYERLALQAETIRINSQHERNLKDQISHLEEATLNQKNLRGIKHDLSEYMDTLKNLLLKKDYDGAMLHIDDITNEIDINKHIVNTGNSGLDAIISSKKNMAESKKIMFKMNLQIPEALPLKSMDMCSIFGNLLENAIEACDKLDDDAKKEIFFRLEYRGGKLYCQIDNTAPTDVKSDYSTTKNNEEEHGFGLYNVIKTLKKYDSEPFIQCVNNIFTVKFSFIPKNE